LWVSSNGWKKINKLEEEAISEILEASAEVATKTMASVINPTALPSVFFSRPKKGHSAPDVMWACAWCLVPYHTKVNL